MDITRVKNNIKARFDYCVAIADDIAKHNASAAVLSYAKKWAEIESPITGETDAPWVRINWGDIYIYIHFDVDSLEKSAVKLSGDRIFQLDPFAAYGGELIDADSIGAFRQELEQIALNETELLRNEYGGDFSADDWNNATPPRDYIPYSEI